MAHTYFKEIDDDQFNDILIEFSTWGLLFMCAEVLVFYLLGWGS